MNPKLTSSSGRQNKQQQSTIDSVGFNTTVNNTIRVLTTQGVETSHISGKHNGPGRQIMDKSFYVNLLKSKMSNITKEISSMKNEVETINKENNEYYALTKTYEGVSKEIQNLEGELADYNLAGDKFRSNMRAEDIEAVYNHIRMNNKKKRDEIDELFIEKSQKEDELNSVEYEISETMRRLEQKLLELEPDQQMEYEQLREEAQLLSKRIYEVKDEITKMNVDIVEGEKFLKNNPNKKEAHRLKEQILQLNHRKDDLSLQLNDSGLSVEEWKEKLVSQYKKEADEKIGVDKKIAEAKRILESYKKSMSEIEKESESTSSVENSKAHNTIVSKDKEYTKYIESFEDMKKSNYMIIEYKEETISAMLESYSNKLQNKQNPKSELKSEVEYKKSQVKKSISTLDEAKSQYESLQVKSKRMNELQPTLKQEIKSIQERIERYKLDMNDKFDKVDFQKNYFKNETSKMKDLMVFLDKNKNSYKTLLEPVKYKSKSRLSKLEEMDSYKKLRELERKMQENENYIHSLITYIDSKEKESDYSLLMKECLDLQQEINSEIIKKTLSVKI